MVFLNELQPAPGARKKTNRKGQGIGSGQGKTAGRGSKGQKSRSGGGVRPGFEGGQMPLQRRLPKRGFTNAPFKKRITGVNVEVLNRFENGTLVSPMELKSSRIVKNMGDGIKILGQGELTRALTVQAHFFSKTAAEKIIAAGGKVEVISSDQ